MTNAELLSLKAALEDKRLELIGRFSSRVAELTVETRDQIAGVLGRFSCTLADIDRSLRAIPGNAYGICMHCHCPISIQRLQSIPWATYCGSCQDRSACTF